MLSVHRLSGSRNDGECARPLVVVSQRVRRCCVGERNFLVLARAFACEIVVPASCYAMTDAMVSEYVFFTFSL